MADEELVAISQAVELANKIHGVAEKAKDTETTVLIAELQIALATVKSETTALVNENLALKQQLEPKQAASQPGSDLQFRDGAYWYTTPAGQSDGPYCPRCKEADNRMVILSKPDDQFVGLFKWRCPQCDKTYT